VCSGSVPLRCVGSHRGCARFMNEILIALAVLAGAAVGPAICCIDASLAAAVRGGLVKRGQGR